MQETRGLFTIEVDLVSVRENPQLSKVEIGIQTLKWIECPCNPVDTLRQNSLALRQLELVTKVKVAIARPDREHMRMMHQLFFITRKAVDKTDKFRFIECADQCRAHRCRGNQHRERHNVEVVDTPHIFLEYFYFAYL